MLSRQEIKLAERYDAEASITMFYSLKSPNGHFVSEQKYVYFKSLNKTFFISLFLSFYTTTYTFLSLNLTVATQSRPSIQLKAWRISKW